MNTTTRIIGVILALILILITAAIALPGFSSPQGTPPAGTVTVYFFYGEECPHCHDVMPVVKALEEKYPDVEFRILEVWHNPENQRVFAAKLKETGSPSTGVPQAIVGKTVLVGGLDIPNGLEAAILEYRKNTP